MLPSSLPSDTSPRKARYRSRPSAGGHFSSVGASDLAHLRSSSKEVLDELHQPRLKSLPAGAFPNDQDAPAQLVQLRFGSGVSFAVSRKFCSPIFLIRFRLCCSGAPLMGMPEAPVNKDDGAVFRKHQIRLAGKVSSAKPIPVSKRMQPLAHDHFRSRIPRSDARHDLRTLFLSKVVRHAS